MWSQLSLLSLLTCLGEDELIRKGHTARVNTEFPIVYGDPLEVPNLHVGGHLEGDRTTVEPAENGGPVSVLEDLSTDVKDEDFILIGEILWTTLCTDTEESVWTYD